MMLEIFGIVETTLGAPKAALKLGKVCCSVGEYRDGNWGGAVMVGVKFDSEEEALLNVRWEE